MDLITIHHIFMLSMVVMNLLTITLKERIVEGKARSKHIKMINDFIDTHEKELYELWDKAQRGERITKILR